jgi:predicted MFS family arabinose efflux permease
MLLSISTARDVMSEDKLGVGIGWIIGAFGVGACLGVGVSGVVSKLLSWRYMFFAECVLLVFGAASVAFLLPGEHEHCDERIDYGGVALLWASLASLIMALTEVLQVGWLAGVLFAFAIVCFGAWIRHERRTEVPLLDVKILASPRVLLPNIASALAGYGAFSAFFLVPRFAQVPRHLPAHVAQQLHYGFGAGLVAVGLYLLPMGVGMLCGGPAGGVVGRRYGGKGPFAGGMVLVTIGSALLALVHTNKFLFAVWLFLLGAGFALSIGSGNVFVAQAVKQSQTGIAIAFNSLMRLIAGGIGAQIAAILIVSQSVDGSHAPHVSAFTIAFGISAVLAAIGVGVALMVPTDSAVQPSN